MIDPRGLHVTISDDRALKGWVPRVPEVGYPHESTLTFAKDEPLAEVAYATQRQRVILFLRLQRRDGAVTIWRTVDQRYGLLPATPALVAEVKEVLAAVARQ